MGSYLNIPGSLGELSANGPTTFWSTGFFLFETPGRRPGASLWSPPMLFMLLRVRDACSAPGGSFCKLGVPRFSHGCLVNSELKFSTAYKVVPALETTPAPASQALLFFLQASASGGIR